MADHVLLAHATRKPNRDSPNLPRHAKYDAVMGFWTKDGVPLVSLADFSGDKRVTKKSDFETGEDQKGE